MVQIFFANTKYFYVKIIVLNDRYDLNMNYLSKTYSY